MAVKVLTDSTCDLPDDVAKKHGLHVIPLNVHIGDQTYKSGVTITADEFYRKLVAGPGLPKTSPGLVSWLCTSAPCCLTMPKSTSFG